MTKQLGYSKALFLGHDYNKTSTLYNIELQLDNSDPVIIKIAFDEKENPDLNKKDQILIFNRILQSIKNGIDI